MKSRTKIAALLGVLILLVAGGLLATTVRESLWPDESLEGRVRQLDSRWAAQRRAAATGLARYTASPDTVVPALTRALDDPDAEVRRNALESFAAFADKSRPAVPALRLTMKQDPDPAIRREAMALLGRIKDRDSVPALIQALDDEAGATQVQAVLSLGQFGPAVATEPLIARLRSTLLESKNELLRLAALDALDSLRAAMNPSPMPFRRPRSRTRAHHCGPGP